MMRSAQSYIGIHKSIVMTALVLFGCTSLQASDAKKTEKLIPLSKAVEVAKGTYNGRVVKADRIKMTSGLAYRIRLVNNGHVKEILVDATSGKLLSQ